MDLISSLMFYPKSIRRGRIFYSARNNECTTRAVISVNLRTDNVHNRHVHVLPTLNAVFCTENARTFHVVTFSVVPKQLSFSVVFSPFVT